jgi:Ctr copper transporter family
MGLSASVFPRNLPPRLQPPDCNRLPGLGKRRCILVSTGIPRVFILGGKVPSYDSHHQTSTMQMNHTVNGSNSPSSELAMMTPYLHFTGGDYLFFRSWHPSTRGAMAGASLALLTLAISDRLLHAVRGVMDARWRKRYGFMTFFHCCDSNDSLALLL